MNLMKIIADLRNQHIEQDIENICFNLCQNIFHPSPSKAEPEKKNLKKNIIIIWRGKKIKQGILLYFVYF